jgi:hypothetical protein
MLTQRPFWIRDIKIDPLPKTENSDTADLINILILYFILKKIVVDIYVYTYNNWK